MAKTAYKIKSGEMEGFYFKILTLYVKWQLKVDYGKLLIYIVNPIAVT